MLIAEITENNAGINISGDYEDLFALREAISDLAGDKTSYDGYSEVHDVVQKFVFELLHAYRAERDSYKTNFDTPCYKFSMLFPEAFFIADVLNDYMELSDGEEFYINKTAGRSSLVAQKIKERKYLYKSYIKFFQTLIYDAIRKYVGDDMFTEIRGIAERGKELRYRGFCKDWVDIINVRYLNAGCGDAELLNSVRKIAQRDEEYYSKEKAMKEHTKDGNISLFFGILEEIQYPDGWEW